MEGRKKWKRTSWRVKVRNKCRKRGEDQGEAGERMVEWYRREEKNGREKEEG